MSRSRSELTFEVPNFGWVLLEPFTYSNGRFGFMCYTKGRSFNLTLNNVDEFSPEPENMLLKMYDEAEIVTRHLMKTTDVFKKEGTWSVGINYALQVTLNPDYYENEL